MLEWLASCGPLDLCLALSLYKTAELRFLFPRFGRRATGGRNYLGRSSRAVARVEAGEPCRARRLAQSLLGARSRVEGTWRQRRRFANLRRGHTNGRVGRKTVFACASASRTTCRMAPPGLEAYRAAMQGSARTCLRRSRAAGGRSSNPIPRIRVVSRRPQGRASVLAFLRQVGNDVGAILRTGHGEEHLCSGDQALRIRQPAIEIFWIPNEVRAPEGR